MVTPANPLQCPACGGLADFGHRCKTVSPPVPVVALGLMSAEELYALKAAIDDAINSPGTVQTCSMRVNGHPGTLTLSLEAP